VREVVARAWSATVDAPPLRAQLANCTPQAP
jgi:hypothetical protein